MTALANALSHLTPHLAPLAWLASAAWHAAAGWVAGLISGHPGLCGVGGLFTLMGWFRSLVRAIDR